MTVIGIGGCTALLLTGFGLKDSISDIVFKQYDDVSVYDMSVTCLLYTSIESRAVPIFQRTLVDLVFIALLQVLQVLVGDRADLHLSRPVTIFPDKGVGDLRQVFRVVLFYSFTAAGEGDQYKAAK